MLNNFLFNNPRYKSRRQGLRTGQTEVENELWQRLRGKRLLGEKFFRQYGVGNYILDFYCPRRKLAIELDGGQHAEPKNVEYDLLRDAYLNAQGITVMRFWNNEVREDVNAVCERISLILRPELYRGEDA